jgi:hypothetical protein
MPPATTCDDLTASPEGIFVVEHSGAPVARQFHQLIQLVITRPDPT